MGKKPEMLQRYDKRQDIAIHTESSDYGNKSNYIVIDSYQGYPII